MADSDIPVRQHLAPSSSGQRLSGLLAAAFLSALWGALETCGRFAFYRWFVPEGWLSVPAVTGVDAAVAVVLSGFEYAMVGGVIGLLAMLFLEPLLRVFSKRDSEWCSFVAPRFAVIFTAVFFNLFWWSRWFVDFAYSERFYSPKRLMFSAFLALIAVAVAAWIVRRLYAMGRLSSRTRTRSLVAVAAIGAVCYGREAWILKSVPEKTGTGQHNVVMVIVDTLRSDRLGCYGYSRPTSPRLDKIAAEGTVFERAFVQAPYTWTSFGSFFTGKYPRRHGLLKMDPTLFFSPKNNLTIQRWLDAQGYRTGAFMTGMLSNSSGLLDGFETYFESTVARDVVHRRSTWSFFRSELVLRMLATKLRLVFDDSLVADEAVDWIDGVRDERFFCLIHLYSPHTPYDPPKRHDIFSPGYTGKLERFTHDHAVAIAQGKWVPTPEDIQRINDLYDGAVHHADAMVGGVYEYLMRKGLLENTIFVVTADHGEELGERGLWEHNWMYNTNQHVPLIVRAPQGVGNGVRVPEIVQSIDVFPTLVELTGVPFPPLPPEEAIDGHSLVPAMRGQSLGRPEVSYCENTTYLSVQNRSWKLVKPLDGSPSDPPRLYRLDDDPFERVNLYRDQPPAVAELEKLWAEFNERMPKVVTSGSRAPTFELLEMMNQGGYTSGASVREGQREAEEAKRRAEEERRKRAQQGDADGKSDGSK